MSPAMQAFQWQLLRLTKGAVKAWETWLRSETAAPRPNDNTRVIYAEYSGSDPT